MTSAVEIRPLSQEDPLRFAVTIRDEAGFSNHEVTASAAYSAEFTGDPRRVVAAAFRFLLDREAKESILPRFDLSEIPRYFPEFERKLRNYL